MATKLPIDMLTELARSRTDEAARRLAALREANLSATRKLELLHEYRLDYGAQLQSLLQAGLPAPQWRNYQDFLKALDAGIEQQRAAAEQAETRLDHGRSDWQHQRRRLNAFETLAERLQRQDAVLQNRREQRASDEHAARMLLDRAARA